MNCPLVDVSTCALVQHISDMDKELQAGEGCHVYGDIRVRRIEGVIRFSVHVKDYMMLASTRKSLEEQMINEFKKFQQNHGVGMVEVRPQPLLFSYEDVFWFSCYKLSLDTVRIRGDPQ